MTHVQYFWGRLRMDKKLRIGIFGCHVKKVFKGKDMVGIRIAFPDNHLVVRMLVEIMP